MFLARKYGGESVFTDRLADALAKLYTSESSGCVIEIPSPLLSISISLKRCIFSFECINKDIQVKKAMGPCLPRDIR